MIIHITLLMQALVTRIDFLVTQVTIIIFVADVEYQVIKLPYHHSSFTVCNWKKTHYCSCKLIIRLASVFNLFK